MHAGECCFLKMKFISYVRTIRMGVVSGVVYQLGCHVGVVIMIPQTISKKLRPMSII